MDSHAHSDAHQDQVTGKPDWAKSGAEKERARRVNEGLPARRRRWPWVLLVLLGAAGVAYGVTSGRPAPAPVDATTPDVAETIMQINTAELTDLVPQNLQRTVRVIGTLAPFRQTELSAQVSGRIEQVQVEPGDTVSVGDVLVQVDVETLTLERDQVLNNAAATRAQLSLAEIQLQRVMSLIERGVTTASSLDEADSHVAALRANLSALEDQVAGAELRLSNATIRSPFDGRVSARSVEPGQYVATGAPLVTVVDLTRMELTGNAPVRTASELKPGQDVAVRVDGIASRDFDGTVVRINPVAEAGSRTIPVYIRIDNPDGILLGGMFALGQIVVEEAPDALAVPTVALREDATGQHLLQVRDNRLVRLPVETGGDWAGAQTRITSGVEAGQIIVTAPLPELQDGDAVEIVEE